MAEAAKSRRNYEIDTFRGSETASETLMLGFEALLRHTTMSSSCEERNKGVRNQRGRGGRTEIHHCGCVCYLRHCPHRRYDGVGRFVQIPTDTDVYLHMTGTLI